MSASACRRRDQRSDSENTDVSLLLEYNFSVLQAGRPDMVDGQEHDRAKKGKERRERGLCLPSNIRTSPSSKRLEGAVSNGGRSSGSSRNRM